MRTVSRVARRISRPRILTVVAVAGLVLAAGLATEQFGSAGNNRRANGRRVTRNDVGNAPTQSAGDETRRTFDEVIEFAEKSRSAIRDAKDYSAVLTKTELIEGRTIHQSMEMKFRRDPFSVYLRCRSKPESGREVIFVPGANGGNLLVHEAGIKSIVGTLKLQPDDPQVMGENRYPITEIGIEKMTESTIAAWKHEKKSTDPANVDLRFFSTAVHGPKTCAEIQISHRHHEPGIEFQLGRLYFDKKTQFLVEVEQYGWPDASEKPPLVEHYVYSDVEVNVGLTDEDFDPRNRNYRF